MSVMNPDKQYTFRCVERGHYNRVYIIQILGDDEEEARRLAEKADGRIISEEPGRHREQVHSQLLSDEDVDFDDLLEVNDARLVDGVSPPDYLPDIANAIQNALRNRVPPDEIVRSIRERFPALPL
jgi:hypothetical protein